MISFRCMVNCHPELNHATANAGRAGPENIEMQTDEAEVLRAAPAGAMRLGAGTTIPAGRSIARTECDRQRQAAGKRCTCYTERQPTDCGCARMAGRRRA